MPHATKVEKNKNKVFKKRPEKRSSKKTGKGRRVEPTGGPVSVPARDNPASVASRFDPLPVFEKDRKKTLFWHFQTLVARGITLSPQTLLPY